MPRPGCSSRRSIRPSSHSRTRPGSLRSLSAKRILMLGQDFDLGIRRAVGDFDLDELLGGPLDRPPSQIEETLVARERPALVAHRFEHFRRVRARAGRRRGSRLDRPADATRRGSIRRLRARSTRSPVPRLRRARGRGRAKNLKPQAASSPSLVALHALGASVSPHNIRARRAIRHDAPVPIACEREFVRVRRIARSPRRRARHILRASASRGSSRGSRSSAERRVDRVERRATSRSSRPPWTQAYGRPRRAREIRRATDTRR